jgi:ABC-2 type transport system permease protein
MAKEFVQMRRDPTTMAMLIGIPLVQLILFGFAINMDPKNLPTAVLNQDQSQYSRQFLYAMENTRYFHFIEQPKSEKEASAWLKQGKVLFVVNIPAHFEKDVIRGREPSILVEADATDPGASGFALASLGPLTEQLFKIDSQGVLKKTLPAPPPFKIEVHAKYNPLRITQFNIVPGLLGVVLTMTMVMITAISITKENERGTIENLLAMPTKPLEIILGKIIPYILTGFLQVLLILIAGELIFHIPMQGSILLLLLLCIPFIAANLAVGLTFSTIASNQLQAMQSTMFFFLPSILLSGFMFPFKGMPIWAQSIGQVLPLTHFLPIVRGILLKGNGFVDCWKDIWPILVFAICALFISLVRFKKTLD